MAAARDGEAGGERISARTRNLADNVRWNGRDEITPRTDAGLTELKGNLRLMSGGLSLRAPMRGRVYWNAPQKATMNTSAPWRKMDLCPHPWRLVQASAAVIDSKSVQEIREKWVLRSHRLGFDSHPRLSSRERYATVIIEHSSADLRQQMSLALTAPSCGLPKSSVVVSGEYVW